MKTLFSLCGTLSNKLSFIVVGIKMNITSFSMGRDSTELRSTYSSVILKKMEENSNFLDQSVVTTVAKMVQTSLN